MDYITTNFLGWSVIVMWSIWFISDLLYVIARKKEDERFINFFDAIRRNVLVWSLVYGSFIVLTLFMKNVMG